MRYLLLLLLFVAGCTTGSHVVTGTAREKIPVSEVKIYASVPTNATVIGNVSAYTDHVDQSGSDQSVKAMKNHAAQIGANGITVEPPVAAGLGMLYNGTAFYVQDK